jgi:CRP-like cAMP-binding protein
MSNIWFIENVNLFDVLCPHQFSEYKNKHSFRTYNKNNFIYKGGDSSNTLYLIAEGKVKITFMTDDGKEVLKAVLAKGEIFGELSLLGETQREEFAQALENGTVLCPMTIDILHELMLQNKNLSLKIHKWIGLRIKKVERKLDLLVNKDVKTRLIEFIKELADERGEKRADLIVVKHPFTQKDIADLIGASRQTVSTLMNEFSQEGLIKMKRGKLLLAQKFTAKLSA